MTAEQLMALVRAILTGFDAEEYTDWFQAAAYGRCPCDDRERCVNSSPAFTN